MTPERAAAEEAEAQDYANAIWSGNKVDWGRWNRAIIARWSNSALLRVKRRAWDIVERGR